MKLSVSWLAESLLPRIQTSTGCIIAPGLFHLTLARAAAAINKWTAMSSSSTYGAEIGMKIHQQLIVLRKSEWKTKVPAFEQTPIDLWPAHITARTTYICIYRHAQWATHFSRIWSASASKFEIPFLSIFAPIYRCIAAMNKSTCAQQHVRRYFQHIKNSLKDSFEWDDSIYIIPSTD